MLHCCPHISSALSAHMLLLKVPRLLTPVGSCQSPTCRPTWTAVSLCQPPCDCILTMTTYQWYWWVFYDHILMIFIRCKWKLAHCFATIVWVLISFLMSLMLLLSIGPNASTLSVQSLLWWAYLNFLLLISFLSGQRSEVCTYAVYRTVSLCQVIFWLRAPYFSSGSSPKVFTSLHCVFNETAYLLSL